MANNQNKTNKTVSTKIENSFKEGNESEISKSGFKQQELNITKKNLRK